MDTNEQVNALTGAANAAKAGGEDWKARYEALKAEYDHDKPMIGRAKASDARVKELEAELKAARDGKSKEELLASLSESVRENVAPEVQAAAAEIAAAALAREREANEARFARLENERAAEREASAEANQRAFMARIETTFPGFLSSVGPGGSNSEAWSKYLEHNRWSVAGALRNGDFGTIDYHVRQFCRSVEIQVPSADGGGAAISDPGNQAGGAVPKPKDEVGKVYTGEEYDALDKRCDQLRRLGRYDEYMKLRDELDLALSEGRVKDA